MRLKVYHAPNIGAAMAMVRTELGPEALILATRPAEDGGVEVTAALETAPQPATPLPDPALQASLRWHGIPERLHPRFSPNISGMHFAPLQLEPHAPPLLLLGPPGAGKTLTAARLATRLVLAGAKPMVITADSKRAGAAEQLAAFTRLLGLTLIAADEPITLARALARRHEGAPVIIDTAGLDGANREDCRELRTLLASAGGVASLVLPAGLDPAEAEEIAESAIAVGASLLIATRLDQSRRLGGIAAAAAAGLALAEAGISANVADGLRPMTPEFLSERLRAVPPPQRGREPAPEVVSKRRELPPYIHPREAQPRWPT